MKKISLALVSLVFSSTAHSAATDIVINQTATAGYTFYNSVFGQSFTATAPVVTAGFKITDGKSLTTKFNTAAYPYPIAPVLKAVVELHEGEGTNGKLLDTSSVSANAPFEGYLDIDYEAKGITLIPGNKYTLLITPATGENYPYTGSGWILSAGYNTSITAPGICSLGGGYVSPGVYSGGNPILGSILTPNDNACPNGVPGDLALHVIDKYPCSGVKEVITGFSQIGSIAIPAALTTKTGSYPVRYPNKLHTTLVSPATFAVGELVTYDGSLDPSHTFCVAPTMTVEVASTSLPLALSTTALPSGTVGVPYNATFSVTGGDGNYSYQYSNPSWIKTNGNAVSGTPTTSGIFSVNVTITDGTGDSLTATLSGNINQAPVVSSSSCTKPSSTKTSEGKGVVSSVGSNYIIVGGTTISFADCTKLSFGSGVTLPQVGDKAEWKGYVNSLNNVMAQKITFN